ncbi:TetR family transcriptional regulator [Actinomadura barringtoniae]|uniref:TetR family transcriptional regulator n=1 Tax=Actinomadura barringtoniae TaxID=1427535 RepID=A0A939T9V2_9ACTN|nr:TetR family transcriptional regulator [Actinomadura barringtoniae]MBO2454689.1 TetR family transcriptional regulator [Actinomadura barringtoniae]
MARPRTTSDEAILAAAARALGRMGPGRLTLGVVAEESGLSPATLVQRFGSKRGLLLALARRAEDGAREPFERARRDHQNPLDTLHAALADLARGVRTPEEMANSLAFLQLDLTDPEFRAHAAAHAHAMRDQIAALLSEASAAGLLTPAADPRRLARAVQVAYNGTLIVWALTGDGDLAAALREDVGDLLAPHRT